MKLCIPVAAPEGLASMIEADFGAAQHLIILDSDSDTFHAVDRNSPEQVSDEIIGGIEGIFCNEIHPRLLVQLQQNGVHVFGVDPGSVADVLAQFRAGELEPLPRFSPPQDGGGCCGGHDHGAAEADHECCGGANHADDHECCGGANHADDHECCGGKGHDHAGHEHGKEGSCGGGGKGRKQGGGCGCAH